MQANRWDRIVFGYYSQTPVSISHPMLMEYETVVSLVRLCHGDQWEVTVNPDDDPVRQGNWIRGVHANDHKA